MEEAIESRVYYSIDIGGRSVPFITDAVVVSWIVMAIIMISVYFMTRRLKTVPDGKQNLAESLVEFIKNFTNGQIGEKHGKAFAAYLCTALLFLAVSNAISIINILPSGETLSAIFHNPALVNFKIGILPPTKNFNVTLCLAVFSMVIVIGAEFRYKGIKGWLKSFYKPTPVSAFIKILDYVVRPMSLCMRLFGNVLGALIVMELLYHAVPLFAPAVFGVYFDIFDGLLQAYVFVFLTALYIAEAVETAEE
ncbi:MAG: F0F1 ATP synthase subunit A [Clostridiales bacterium]|jgi:F-type H+-transporting ATPase subunit a|nr:F0F1 ATP synthase subunit A [Clostridiales bacterium]